MLILDEISDQHLEKVILYLTYSEAIELRDSLNEIIENPSNNHAHVFDEKMQKEITMCIYDIKNLKGFNKRSVDLILNDS